MEFATRNAECGMAGRITDTQARVLSSRTSHSALRIRPAFTLVELLISITIIAALAGLLIPAIGHFRRVQRRAAIMQFAGAIQTGLTAYEHDYRDLPPSYAHLSVMGIGARPPLSYSEEWDGGEILAQAMLGPLGDTDATGIQKDRPTPTSTMTPYPATPPDDGMNGYGFRSPAGKKSGPYIDLKNERNLQKSPSGRDGAYVLSMPYGDAPTPFLYFRANPRDNAGGDFKNAPNQAIWHKDLDPTDSVCEHRFVTNDNDDLIGGAPFGTDIVAKWESAKYYVSGSSEEAEREAFVVELRSKDYLLVHAGADGEFGSPSDLSAAMDNVVIPGVRTSR